MTLGADRAVARTRDYCSASVVAATANSYAFLFASYPWYVTVHYTSHITHHTSHHHELKYQLVERPSSVVPSYRLAGADGTHLSHARKNVEILGLDNSELGVK